MVLRTTTFLYLPANSPLDIFVDDDPSIAMFEQAEQTFAFCKYTVYSYKLDRKFGTQLVEIYLLAFRRLLRAGAVNLGPPASLNLQVP